MPKIVVIGAGIVGLATARRLALRGDDVVVLEKESRVAAHQTGRNSGVVHAGLYYTPGSLKAKLAVAGAASMLEFAREHGIPHEVCGKLIVASHERDLARLEELSRRAQANGVPVRRITQAEAREIEPHVSCLEALHVPSTAIIDYRAVCEQLARDFSEAGGELQLGVEAFSVVEDATGVTVTTNAQLIRADALIACGGLHADRVARACGVEPEARIVPFRGEYFSLEPSKAAQINGLIYPVPDPRFPFLGVHLTRMIGGGAHVGPNAVPAFKREGYSRRDVDFAEVRSLLAWRGSWNLARRNAVSGIRELSRSLSRRSVARCASAMLPGVRAADLTPAPSGVRAQAVTTSGDLVDDFLVQTSGRQVHVLNAPSPAATASLEIAGELVADLDRVLSR
ncbi:MAG TPA: L-2-hydroxyglutarate oxidase [Marmoricola sp.]|nr:L-2-hydroxyglutarate oxidase [Marmoricola sp.]